MTKCLALVGGTGSSPAGFECTGTYTYRGTAYSEGVPGSADLPVGSTVHGIIAAGDPALFSTPRTVASEQAGAARACCLRSCWSPLRAASYGSSSAAADGRRRPDGTGAA